MSGAHAIVQQLFNTGNSTAVGFGYVVQALLNFAKQSPVIVELMNKEGATRVMVFSRQKLSIKFHDAMELFKRDFGIAAQRGYYISQVKVDVTGVLIYNEDGTVQTTPVMISQESWPDLMTHVHKIFIRTPDI